MNYVFLHGKKLHHVILLKIWQKSVLSDWLWYL